MMNGREVEARTAPMFPDVLRAASELEWTEDDEESLRTIKLGAALGVLMLVAYLEYDLRISGHSGIGATFHWIILGGTTGFFLTLWTRAFRRQWKLWTFSICIFLMWMFTVISASTHDPESRFITMALCPLATASFVNWGSRWQFAMASASLAAFCAAQYFVPIENPFIMYQWLGLVAALAIAQFTAVYLERYRRRLIRQVEDLEQAARFRQNQIATMAHDIRSPVAALSGYVSLLEEDHVDPIERADVLGRIGSTAWYMDLLVSNVLDLYQVEEGNIIAAPIVVNPNLLLGEITADCATQARRRRLGLRTEFSTLPHCLVDPRHFDRIVKNLIAFAIARTITDEVIVRTSLRSRWIVIEVTDDGSLPTPDELATLFEPPSADGRKGRARGLGLYIARAMAQAAGGRVEARYAGARGITLSAELTIEAAPLNPQLK